MLRSLTSGKIGAGVLITILILIALGASYFFIYIPGNEATMQERRFRCLRNIEAAINTKIDNSKARVENLLNNYDQALHSSDPKQLDAIRKYIEKYPKDNFTLLLPEQADDFKKDAKQIYTIGKDTTGTITFYLDVSSELTLLATSTKNTAQAEARPLKKEGRGLTIGMRFDFKKFIRPLLFSDIFDHYIVFINNKKIYEDYRTGLNLKSPDSLLTIKSEITTPGIRSLQIGGTEYKLFSQPVYTSKDYQWTVTGLVDINNYKKEKTQLPLWTLLLLFTTAITICVFLPWIKLYNMGNKDRLSTKDMVLSLLVAMILMSLLFFIFFKYRVDLKIDRFSNRTSRSGGFDSYTKDTLAKKVTNAFVKETKDALRLLSIFDKNHEDSDADVARLGSGKGKYDSLKRKFANNIDLKQIYWLDKNGFEKTNLTVNAYNDPKTDYSKRDYFSSMKRFINSDNETYYLSQVISLTDGTFRSVISKKSLKSTAAVMSFNMKSLQDVIMPEGYQFAIITSAGWGIIS